MVKKATTIATARATFATEGNQWWQKSINGKSWELWDDDGTSTGLRLIKRIPSKRVFWVLPKKEVRK